MPQIEDIIMDSPTKAPLPEAMELTDTSGDEVSDVDMDRYSSQDPDSDTDMRPPAFVFNTNLPINPRRTIRPWVGSLRPEDWVPSREELHADQVDFARSLPLEMSHAGYPAYVSLFYLKSLTTTYCLYPGHLPLRYGIDARLSHGPLRSFGL